MLPQLLCFGPGFGDNETTGNIAYLVLLPIVGDDVLSNEIHVGNRHDLRLKRNPVDTGRHGGFVATLVITIVGVLEIIESMLDGGEAHNGTFIENKEDTIT